MQLGDFVLVSPDLTSMKEWIKAKIIDIENNSFVGQVISVQTEDGNVFFGRGDMFKLAL